MKATMNLIETTSPLYLRRLVREINAAPAAYLDGSIVKRHDNPRRNGRASYFRTGNAILFFAGVNRREVFTIQASDAERAFCDGAGRTIVASRQA